MVEDFGTRLQSADVLVADGAIGTNLQAAGLTPGMPAEEWVIDRPDAIRSLHRSFVEAGSDLILTCSFGGNRIGMSRSQYAGRVAELNRSAAHMARLAADEADRTIFVGGSMGPTGSLVEPYGSLGLDEVSEVFAEQARALEEGGVDFLILETFFAIEEARAAIEGVVRVSDLPLICSFSYDRGTRTMMGVSPTAMVDALGDLRLAAVGANCGRTTDDMEEIIDELVAATDLPVWAKPNAGLPEGDPPHYRVTPEQMAAYGVRYRTHGARVIGGCCGTTPEHVKDIADAIQGSTHDSTTRTPRDP
ncbi:MAG: methionine synthase [Rhodothermales bacterium]|nr:methionine synthase [Rhodothermales bacterium]